MPMLPNYHTAQYFDVGALSMEDERVPCSTTVEITGLGYLDPSSQTDDLEAQSKVEVPLWLATLLVKKGYVHMDMPKMFNKRSREHLDAGAASVNLREKSPQYFTVGIELARIKKDDDLQKKLLTAFTAERFRDIMDLAFNSQNDDVSEKTRNFTDIEQNLFNSGFQPSVAFSEWKSGKQKKIRVSAAADSS